MKKTSYLNSFLKFASLNVLGMIGISVYILADTFFVSKGLGTNGLAALNLAIPVYSIIHGSGLMLGMGGATKYSVAISMGEKKKPKDIFTNTVFAAAVFSFAFICAGLFFSGKIASLLGAQGEIFDMTFVYLKILLIFSPAFLMNNILICFVRNDGNPKLAMLAMLGGSALNIVLDYIFIFPLQMHMFGAVFATCLSPIFSMLILLFYILKKRNNFSFIKTNPNFGVIKSLVFLGLPSLITELASGVVIIVFNFIMLELEGSEGVAAYGIVANVALVAIAVCTGIAQGSQPLISRAYGVGDRGSMRKLIGYALTACAVISAAIYAVIFIFSSPIAAVFNSENNFNLQQTAVDGLRLYFISLIFSGLNIVFSVYFTSAEKAMPAQIISLLRGLILIVPIAFLMSSVWGTSGLWLSVTATEIPVLIISVIMYIKAEKNMPKSDI